MQLSRQTLTNWLEKGSLHVKELVKRLKDICLVKDCIINCDETWCRVKVEGCYRKKYIWCLVNKKEKIVIYSYEDGSRGRDALKHILGDCQVKALQSDGYNVYMYLDDHIVNTEHLCCMAHARAKFKYAEEQGDKDAQFFLDLIGQLYELESEYEIAGLNPEEVKVKRNGFKTKDIIIQIRSKLDALLASNHPYRGEMMEKALRYLDTFIAERDSLAQFLRYVVTKSDSVKTLVINGDFLDEFTAPMDVMPIADKNGKVLSEQEFFGQIVEANQMIFDELKAVKSAGIEIVYVPGNHDMLTTSDDFRHYFGNLFTQARESLGMGKYEPMSDIVIEHSHRYDIFNAPDHISNNGIDNVSDESILPVGFFLCKMASSFSQKHGGSSFDNTTKEQVEKMLDGFLTQNTIIEQEYFRNKRLAHFSLKAR